MPAATGIGERNGITVAAPIHGVRVHGEGGEVYLGECTVFVQHWKQDNRHRHFVLQAQQLGEG